ncbi:hypothetical protein LINGRAHAP2_LOCUS25010 [Linum grandiflorum]
MRLLRPDGGMHAGLHRTNQRKVQRQVGLRALQRSRQRRDHQKNTEEKRLISTDETLARHISFYKQFSSPHMKSKISEVIS